MTIDQAFAPQIVALAVVSSTMMTEAVIARRHETWLRARGAVEPAGDVYGWMQLAYPLGFAACIVESWWRGVGWSELSAAGLTVFVLGKAVKYTAIATLGRRWTFRVLPLPGAPCVTRGIYRWWRHPNYVGVALEIIGLPLWMVAPIAGLAFAATFGWLLLARIKVEERALAAAAPR